MPDVTNRIYRAQIVGSLAQLVMGQFPITVSTDWTVAGNVITDVETATGMVLPDDVEVQLWEGSGDADDFAVVNKVDGTAEFGQAFDSAPAVAAVAFLTLVRLT